MINKALPHCMLCGFVMTFYLLVIKSDWSSLNAFPPARIIKIIELDGQGSIRIKRLRTGPGDWSAHVFGLDFGPHTGRTHPSNQSQSPCSRPWVAMASAISQMICSLTSPSIRFQLFQPMGGVSASFSGCPPRHGRIQRRVSAAVNVRACLIFMVVGFLVHGPAVPPPIRSGRRSGLA